jgi:hypothetical protein
VTWPLVIDPTWSEVSGAKTAWTVLRKSEPTRSFYNATSVDTNDSTRGLVRAGFNDWEGPSTRPVAVQHERVRVVRLQHGMEHDVE